MLMKQPGPAIQRRPASVANYGALYRLDLWDSKSEDPSFQDVVEIFKNPDVHLIAGGLRKLAEKYPAFMSNYSLMYNSGSLQRATYLLPRAIVFGETAKFILTFNGIKGSFGYNTIETVEYDGYSYAFREIQFLEEPKYQSQSVSDQVLAEDEIDRKLSTGRILVSKPNPAKCISCHGYVEPHPIWESYFMWPGAYGSEDDNVFGEGSSLHRTFALKGTDDPEKAGFAQFNLLRASETEPARTDYARYTALKPLSAAYQADRPDHPVPNLILTNLLTGQAYDRLSKRLVEYYRKAGNKPEPISCASGPVDHDTVASLLANVVKMKKDFGPSMDRTVVTRGLGSDGGKFDRNERLVNEAAASDDFKRLRAMFPDHTDFELSAALSCSISDTCVAANLKKTGLDLQDFAINHSRAPTFNGVGLENLGETVDNRVLFLFGR